jgi:hypothetical protein
VDHRIVHGSIGKALAEYRTHIEAVERFLAHRMHKDISCD